ncbi:hypothetical protein KUCAC02_027140 [Chaenocephalus aceratus]|uniref:Uncharacterized protein n=1 Tax=Chaenocephalus aceratus TaxID=36190 RepID=A0ACB9W2W8_CHAAC|nr:hypothetical protein KUCAC02_027140 [Chaenocephalus aceratus]
MRRPIGISPAMPDGRYTNGRTICYVTQLRGPRATVAAPSTPSCCHRIIGRWVTRQSAGDLISSIREREKSRGNMGTNREQPVIYKACERPPSPAGADWHFLWILRYGV